MPADKQNATGRSWLHAVPLGKLKHSTEPKPHAANLLQSWRRSLSGPDPGPCPGDATRRPRQLWKVAHEASTMLSARVSTQTETIIQTVQVAASKGPGLRAVINVRFIDAGLESQ
ncbi:hypothetical protein CFAM422_007343 [Trichoderma lentiforme]|uniref:Uncharacterized protein n=1 Tax=Trichoderma lentiforme TaxID=1567552 RepID=A0A9P4XDQ1_9HYPO|nr:hypothetical protein CFAM422_007343 [Trichoderma lentiforme]